MDLSSNNYVFINPIFSFENIINNLHFFPLNEEEDESNVTIDELLNNSLYEQNPYIDVISKEGEKQLKYEIYNENLFQENQEKICAITREEFKHGEQIITLPCNHYFSKLAIEKWLKNESATCPICKFKLKSVEIKNNSNTNSNTNSNVNSNNNLIQETSFINIINHFQETIEEEQIQEALLNSYINNYSSSSSSSLFSSSSSLFSSSSSLDE